MLGKRSDIDVHDYQLVIKSGEFRLYVGEGIAKGLIGRDKLSGFGGLGGFGPFVRLHYSEIVRQFIIK